MFLEKIGLFNFNNENMKSMVEEKWRVQSCETLGMTWYCFFWTSETPCTIHKFAFGYCLETRQFKFENNICETLLKKCDFLAQIAKR